MQRFKIEYEILANNKDQALAKLDAMYLTRLTDLGVDVSPLAKLCARANDHARMLGLSAAPMHKSTSPDFEIPDSLYCYYLRNPETRIRFACVVFGRDIATDKWARGISICSNSEKNFDRVEAKGRAYSRYLMACCRRKNWDSISPFTYPSTGMFISEVCKDDTYVPADMVYKSGYDVLLSQYEIKLVQGRKYNPDIAMLPEAKDIAAKSATLGRTLDEMHKKN